MEKLASVGDVIDELGGASAVGVLTGRTQPAVSNWKIRGKFSPETFLVITQALKERKKSAPAALWGIDEPALS